MSEKEKNIVPSTAEAEMSEEEKQKLLEQFDKESKTRKFGSPVLKKAYRVFAIIVTLYHLVFASGLYMPETLKHRSIHVGMILILAFMLYPATKKASRKRCLPIRKHREAREKRYSFGYAVFLILALMK